MKNLTPRKLRITVELDVTEGPRLRRGTREAELMTKLGEPIRLRAMDLAEKRLGLSTGSATCEVSWGYVWLNAAQKVIMDGGEEVVVR